MGMGHYNGWGIYDLMGGGIYGLDGWASYVKVSSCFVWKYAQKMLHGLQGSTLSDHCMTTGFGPLELPTCGLLQKGLDHSPLKACIYLRSPVLGLVIDAPQAFQVFSYISDHKLDGRKVWKIGQKNTVGLE